MSRLPKPEHIARGVARGRARVAMRRVHPSAPAPTPPPTVRLRPRPQRPKPTPGPGAPRSEAWTRHGQALWLGPQGCFEDSEAGGRRVLRASFNVIVCRRFDRRPRGSLRTCPGRSRGLPARRRKEVPRRRAPAPGPERPDNRMLWTAMPGSGRASFGEGWVDRAKDMGRGVLRTIARVAYAGR